MGFENLTNIESLESMEQEKKGDSPIRGSLESLADEQRGKLATAEANVDASGNKIASGNSLINLNVEKGVEITKDESDGDVDSKIKPETEQRKTGGSYGELIKQEGREGKQMHHMPADDVSPLKKTDGPSIEMDEKDHRKTASYGYSKEAQEYRAQQKELIEQGKFKEAFEMDVKDIQEKFGDKYDGAIEEARAYLDKLEEEGKVKC
jgi:hypothetical protein